jgi:hypothetical protein
MDMLMQLMIGAGSTTVVLLAFLIQETSLADGKSHPLLAL